MHTRNDDAATLTNCSTGIQAADGVVWMAVQVALSGIGRAG